MTPVRLEYMLCVIVRDTSSLLLSACSTKENGMAELLLTVTKSNGVVH